MFGEYPPICQGDERANNFTFNIKEGTFMPYEVKIENSLANEPQLYPFPSDVSVKFEEPVYFPPPMIVRGINEDDEDVKKIKQHIRTSSRYDVTKELIKKFERVNCINNLAKIKLSHYRTYEYLLCYLRITALESIEYKHFFIAFINQELESTVREKISKLKRYREEEKEVFFYMLFDSMRRIVQAC